MMMTMTRPELLLAEAIADAEHDLRERSAASTLTEPAKPPTSRAAEPQPRAAQSPPPPARRILVADDESRIRLAIRCCLEAEGYEVEEAADGREALAAIVHGAPDLVLLDLAMPNLDGLSTLEQLATFYAPVRPPVVVLTAYGSVTAAARAYELGAKAFLEKPLVPNVLRGVVAQVLRDHAAEQANAEDAERRADPFQQRIDGFYLG